MAAPEATQSFPPSQGTVSLERTGASDLLIRLRGKWQLRRDLPAIGVVDRELQGQRPPRRVVFDASGLKGWDSGLISFLVALDGLCGERGIECDRDGLPAGVRRLLDLAEAVPEKQGARTA